MIFCDKMSFLDTPKRKIAMLHLLHAYESDYKKLPEFLSGWRSVEWTTPRFDENYYIMSEEDKSKAKKKIMEFLRVLKENDLVERATSSEIKNLLETNVNRDHSFKFKEEMGFSKHINTMWRINPKLLDETKKYFDSEDMISTAIELKEVNVLIDRLNDHLDTLITIKELLNTRLVSENRQKVRGEILEHDMDLEALEKKIDWIKDDLDFLKSFISE